MSDHAATHYSTGGGGVALEHKYGAVLLSQLLAGDPIGDLGADITPLSVLFQASIHSQVDDLVVTGIASNGDSMSVSIGVRRAPKLVPSHNPTVKLFGAFLKVVSEKWNDIETGKQRIVLAVASSDAAISELRHLTSMASASTNSESFRDKVARTGGTNRRVRSRLTRIDEIIAKASNEIGINSTAFDLTSMTWRLLLALSVRELRLEEGNDADRSNAISVLRSFQRGDVSEADLLFSRLVELVGQYAPTGSEVSEPKLRRDLEGIKLNRSPNCIQAWRVLDSLDTHMRDRVRHSLSANGKKLELEREDALVGLLKRITASSKAAATLVRGEPDVGKSSLTLRAADRAITEGAVAILMNLRDLPQSIIEFEGLLGVPLGNVFGLSATSSSRLLIVDGSEAVLEGKEDLLRAIAIAAFRNGIRVVAVSRSDGALKVESLLNEAIEMASLSSHLDYYEVPSLLKSEIERLTTTFDSLATLSVDSRADWLFMRLGLVELLLRANGIKDLPDGPISEAHVFAIIWKQLVRGERSSSFGPEIQELREETLKTLALRTLLSDPSIGTLSPSAIPSLRSDGLLLDHGVATPWSSREEFASDLVRDLAVTRIVITKGWSVVADAQAPRWALRAVRIACQAKLLEDASVNRPMIQAVFSELATQFGRRWEEVPLEAILTLGFSKDMLTMFWLDLQANDSHDLRILIRLALQRYTHDDLGDVQILAPLVELTFCEDSDLDPEQTLKGRGLESSIRKLVLAWLRGMAYSDANPSVLRQSVRDRIFEMEPTEHDDFALEAIGMLGSDLDEKSVAFLKEMLHEAPHQLGQIVETNGPLAAMTRHQPNLLLELSEAFYIEKPSQDELWRSFDILEDGIRRHTHFYGVGAPMATWYYGPFFRLLQVEPIKTLALINKMLDHAALYRTRQATTDISSATGLDLLLPETGLLKCVGDASVWCWYRGSSVGPYPCMSALLAVEKFADNLIDVFKIPIPEVLRLLLRDCHNLAMPGLVVGLIERHLDQAAETLDGFLIRPELWYMEIERVTSEGQWHVQGLDADDVHGREQRKMGFPDAVAQMTIAAVLARDEDRKVQLAGLGEELSKNGSHLLQTYDPSNAELAVIHGWASMFVPESFTPSMTTEGVIEVEFKRPESVSEVLGPRQAELARFGEAMRLEVRYGRAENRIADVTRINEDIIIARSFVEVPPVGVLHPADPVAAVAAAAIIAHSDGRANVSDEDLLWCAEQLMESAIHPWNNQFSSEFSIYPMGADRSSAAAVARLLLPEFVHLNLNSATLSTALDHLATSQFDEVRIVFAESLPLVWNASCDGGAENVCRHTLVWSAVQLGLAGCTLGDWDMESQQKRSRVLEEPYLETLPKIATKDILLNRIIAPIIASASASRASNCVVTASKVLLEVLLATHLRVADHWAQEGYELRNQQDLKIQRLLIELMVAEDAEPLLNHVRSFMSNPRALQKLLLNSAEVFTYSDELRKHITPIWRQMFEAALTEFDSGAKFPRHDSWASSALGLLIPNPHTSMQESAYDEVIARTKNDWVRADAISDLVDRWIVYAKSESTAVDAIARLSRGMDVVWQSSIGLSWVEQLINDDYYAISNRTFYFTNWLEDLRPGLQTHSSGFANWIRVVDGLASANDRQAVVLQENEE